MDWLLLIYTVPAQPSRARAYVWRELKKLGGVYLRDGVCALPDRQHTHAAFDALAQRIRELEGQATVAHARLDIDAAASIQAQSQLARNAEFADIQHEAERFLAYLEHESTHRALDPSERAALHGDLGKLDRWLHQVRERDYFDAPGSDAIQPLLQRARQTLESSAEAVR